MGCISNKIAMKKLMNWKKVEHTVFTELFQIIRISGVHIFQGAIVAADSVVIREVPLI